MTPHHCPLADTERQLAGFPPLVFAGEARNLKKQLGEVCAGEAFLLQGGDCAESFAEHSAEQHPRLFPRLPADGGGADLCRRFAGGEGGAHRRPVRQAAQRADREAGDVELPSYRGDIINGNEFTPEARIPDPRRQIEAYRQSAATLNLLRAFAHGGYANLATVHQWMLGFVKDSPQPAAIRNWPTGSRRRSASCAPCGLDLEKQTELRRPISIPVTRRFCSASRRR
jgi:3-deoxy-7-phosphoheptulonate synthase